MQTYDVTKTIERLRTIFSTGSHPAAERAFDHAVKWYCPNLPGLDALR
jgi:hypothetical protein